MNEGTWEFPPLPISGKKVVLRQLTGEDEMAAANEAGDGTTPASRIALDHALVQRSIVSIGDQQIDKSTLIGSGVRNLFDPRDWQCVLSGFRQIHLPERAAFDTFLGGATLASR